MKLKEFKKLLSTDQDMIIIIDIDYCCREISYILNHSDVNNFLNNCNTYSSEEFAIRRHELEDKEVITVIGFDAEGYDGIKIYLYEEE